AGAVGNVLHFTAKGEGEQVETAFDGHEAVEDVGAEVLTRHADQRVVEVRCRSADLEGIEGAGGTGMDQPGLDVAAQNFKSSSGQVSRDAFASVGDNANQGAGRVGGEGRVKFGAKLQSFETNTNRQ